MHPILFQIHGFVVGTYGVAIVAGMLAALGVISYLARRRGLSPEFFFDLTFVLLISGMLGARLFYVLLNFGEFLQSPLKMLLSRQGFVFQGGFICALAAGLVFTRRRRMPLFEACDIVAPALVLAHGFGRIGCFLAGCCYGCAVEPGKANALERFLGVQYPLITGSAGAMFNFAYEGQKAQGVIGPDAAAPLPILPVQLFEMAGNFAICLVLLYLWRRRRFSGQIFALYLILYSLLRFGLEFLRGDAERGLWFAGRISTAQIICLLTILTGLALWYFRRHRGFQPLPQPGGPASGIPGDPPQPGARGKQRPASRRA